MQNWPGKGKHPQAGCHRPGYDSSPGTIVHKPWSGLLKRRKPQAGLVPSQPPATRVRQNGKRILALERMASTGFYLMPG